MNSLSRQLTTGALAIAATSITLGFNVPTHAATVACQSTQSLRQLINYAGSACQDMDIDGNLGAGDKKYTINTALTSNANAWLNGNVAIAVDNGSNPIESVHKLSYQRVGTLPWAANSNKFVLAYTIAITDPENFFKAASIGVDVTTFQNGIKTTTEIWTDGFNGSNLITGSPTNIINAGQAGPLTVLPIYTIQTLYVINTVTRTSSIGNFNNFTNNFVQAEIPEPSAVFGILAVAGLGIASRIRWK